MRRERVKQTFSAVIYKEDDLYVAECLEVGTVSQDYTLDEAMSNLQEATELYEECELRSCLLSPRAYVEALEFLATNPTPVEILAFHPSTAIQMEVHRLLDKLDAGVLTLLESNELDRVGELEHIMIALKARAATIKSMREEPCPNPD